MEIKVINPEKDRETLYDVVGKYLDARFGAGGLSAERNKNEIEKRKLLMLRNGVNEQVVDRFVRVSEIEAMLETNGVKERLLLSEHDNLKFVSRVPIVQDGVTTRAVGSERLDLITIKHGYNFLFVEGVGVSVEGDNGVDGNHYVAARAVRDPETGEIALLHRDSKHEGISEEFKIFARREFGDNIRIVNIENQEGVMCQNDGTTCGLRALACLVNGGLFYRIEERIAELGSLNRFIGSGEVKLSVISAGNKILFSGEKNDRVHDPDSYLNISELLLDSYVSMCNNERTEFLPIPARIGDKRNRKIGEYIEKDSRETEVLVALLIQNTDKLGLTLGTCGTEDNRGATTNFGITNCYHHLEKGTIAGQIDAGGSYNMMFRLSGWHDDFVSAKIFRDLDGKIIVLHIDPQNKGVSKEFQEFISEELRGYGNFEIKNIESDNKKSKSGRAGSMETLMALGNGGSLAKTRAAIIRESRSAELKRNKVELKNCRDANSEINDRLFPQKIVQ
ncbi:MAG: hypothetical protein LBI29_02105 [Rickettsiales bacterium]|nr:hypothetical protein [Rickettsiales bacterium]